MSMPCYHSPVQYLLPHSILTISGKNGHITSFTALISHSLTTYRTFQRSKIHAALRNSSKEFRKSAQQLGYWLSTTLQRHRPELWNAGPNRTPRFASIVQVFNLEQNFEKRGRVGHHGSHQLCRFSISTSKISTYQKWARAVSSEKR